MAWLVRLAYDGTDLHGAAEASGLPTVAGALREALARLGADDVAVDVLSRTDAGVHARGNVVVVEALPVRPVETWLRALAHQLPDAIRPTGLAEVAAIPAVVDKTYRYVLDATTPGDPFRARTAWRVDVPWDGLVAAAAVVRGEVDWGPFRRRDERRQELRRHISACSWNDEGGLWALRVTGTGFPLRGVRSLVGAMVHVARGHATPGDLRAALDGKPRDLARQQAPARGLFLESIRFDQEIPWVELTPRSGSS